MTLLAIAERPRAVSSDIGDLSLDMTGLKALTSALQEYTGRDHILPGLDETASRCQEIMADNMQAIAAMGCRQTVETNFDLYEPNPPQFYFMTSGEKARIDARDKFTQDSDYVPQTRDLKRFVYEANIPKRDLRAAFFGSVDANYKPLPLAPQWHGDPKKREANLQDATGEQTGIHEVVSRQAEPLEYLVDVDALFPVHKGKIDKVKDDMALLVTWAPHTTNAPLEVMQHRLKLANKNFQVTLPTWPERRVAAIALRQYARRTDGPSRVLAIDALEQLSSNRLSAFLEKTLVYTGMPVIKAASFLSRVIGRSRTATVE